MMGKKKTPKVKPIVPVRRGRFGSVAEMVAALTPPSQRHLFLETRADGVLVLREGREPAPERPGSRPDGTDATDAK